MLQSVTGVLYFMRKIATNYYRIYSSQFISNLSYTVTRSVMQEIIHKNSHVHDEIGRQEVSRMMSCTYLSEYDKIACSAVYGYSSESEYAEAVSSIGRSLLFILSSYNCVVLCCVVLCCVVLCCVVLCCVVLCCIVLCCTVLY